MTSALHGSPYPLPTEPGEAHQLTRLERERYLDLFDAGDQYDADLAADWDALDNPTRPADRELLP